MNQALHVRIISPQQLILDVEAESVSSKNSQGSFDILPLHANFITLVEDNPITVHLDKNRMVKFRFPLSIVFTSDNRVNIYTYAQELRKPGISSQYPS